MNIKILENITIDTDNQSLVSFNISSALIDEAVSVGGVKAIVNECFIDTKQSSYVSIDSIRFASPMLSQHVSMVNRIFPFIVTCGENLEKWSMGKTGQEKEQADHICQAAMLSGVNEVIDYVKSNFNPGPLHLINALNIDDWDYNCQQAHFQILVNPEGMIGIDVDKEMNFNCKHYYIGFLHSEDSRPENCQRCNRINCTNRMAECKNI